MAKITITEALAEIKTTRSRIQKKREAILQHLGRPAQNVDPLAKSGGSEAFVKQERQAIRDLEDKIVKIRTAIQVVNQKSELSVEGMTNSIAGWLNWRREIANTIRDDDGAQFLGEQAFLATMAQSISQQRAMWAKTPQRGVTADAAANPQGDYIAHLDEVALSGEIEHMTNVLGQLDGKLSLLNATTTIDV